jgi:hypothetical protein
MAKDKSYPRYVVKETGELPIVKKTLRLYFFPDNLLLEIKKAKFQKSGVRLNENDIYTEALIDFANQLLGKEEVQKCLKK